MNRAFVCKLKRGDASLPVVYLDILFLSYIRLESMNQEDVLP